MVFFICMFICNLLIPATMIITGYFMYKKPPKEINGVIGYRTTMSRKNMDTWKFAHDYCGRLWLKLGIILLVPSIIVQIPFVNSDENTVGILTLIIEGVQLVFLLGSILPVERALKRTFDENGKRRSRNME
ncbi:MAG: SdpI family protein [Lachnospiraceae bacterium]|nr:SdpI family protein [Lachnospiraceae bacterium]